MRIHAIIGGKKERRKKSRAAMKINASTPCRQQFLRRLLLCWFAPVAVGSSPYFRCWRFHHVLTGILTLLSV